jgi:predicted O-methyltransferase YrrM
MEHYWRDLPGPNWFSGAAIYRRYVDSVRTPSVAVELGAWKGRSTCFMAVEIANSGKAITFYTVDNWQGSIGEEEQEHDPDVQAGRLFGVFQQNVSPVASRVNVIRSDSAAAAERFADGSVDFLYVDAGHSFEGVLSDLAAWFPKVRDGGLIAGDDWCQQGVRSAVIAFFGRDRSRIRVEAGEPNENWLQWSIVKTTDLRVSSRIRCTTLRLLSSMRRSMPARALRKAARRLVSRSSLGLRTPNTDLLTRPG